MDFFQCTSFFSVPGQRARGKNATLMRSFQWRCTVSMGFSKNNLALGSHAIDVVDRSGNKLFQQIKRLLIPQLLEPGPQSIRPSDLFLAGAGTLGSRLD